MELQTPISLTDMIMQKKALFNLWTLPKFQVRSQGQRKLGPIVGEAEGEAEAEQVVEGREVLLEAVGTSTSQVERRGTKKVEGVKDSRDLTGEWTVCLLSLLVLPGSSLKSLISFSFLNSKQIPLRPKIYIGMVIWACTMNHSTG